MRLNLDDLREVRALLYPVRRKWHDIGIELELKVEELDTIKAAYTDHRECLTEMIKMWLRSINPLPTWKALGDALKAGPVHEVALAEAAYLKDGPIEHTTDKVGATPASKTSTPEDEEQFPLLKVKIKDLTEEQKEKLLLQLNQESKEILEAFAILVTHTQGYLCDSNISAELWKGLFTECKRKELADQIKSTDTISTIFDTIRRGDYWSFFNYELLKTIIKCFGGPQLIAELDEYISKFKVYCNRRVSEVPRDSLTGGHTHQQSGSIFKVKMDKIFDITLEKIKEIQDQLYLILNKTPLLLANVEDGCIELTFRYFRLLPLTEVEKAAIDRIGLQHPIPSRMAIAVGCVDSPQKQSEQMPEYDKEEIHTEGPRSKEQPSPSEGASQTQEKPTAYSTARAIDSTEAAVKKEVHIVLVGRRRSGKSRLLHTLEREKEMSAFSMTIETHPSTERELTKHTHGKVNLVLYCLPVEFDFERDNPSIMRSLQETYGKEVWHHCIVALTFSDMTWKRSCLEYHTHCFQQQLEEMNIHDVHVRPTFHPSFASRKNTIMAVPVCNSLLDILPPHILSSHLFRFSTRGLDQERRWLQVLVDEMLKAINREKGAAQLQYGKSCGKNEGITSTAVGGVAGTAVVGSGSGVGGTVGSVTAAASSIIGKKE